MPIEKVPEMIIQLYEIVDKLESCFPGRKFTPDGHMVGSIGEVLASYYYGIELLPASAATHDGISKDGRYVQIKATQAKSVGIRSCPDYLLVLLIKRDGSFEEVYNGPGEIVWASSSRMQSNGQRSISTTKLRSLMENVNVDTKIKHCLNDYVLSAAANEDNERLEEYLIKK